MKHTLLALLIFPIILFAQEPETQPEDSEEVHVIDVDPRCKNAVTWGIKLMVNKQNGYPYEDVKRKLEFDWMFGPLSSASPEVLAYMIDIVDLVYSHKENRTMPEIVEASKELNELCVTFMDTPTPARPKQSSVRT